jgi:hypothetical protein
LVGRKMESLTSAVGFEVGQRRLIAECVDESVKEGIRPPDEAAALTDDPNHGCLGLEITLPKTPLLFSLIFCAAFQSSSTQSWQSVQRTHFLRDACLAAQSRNFGPGAILPRSLDEMLQPFEGVTDCQD